jgi:hypothetical protein
MMAVLRAAGRAAAALVPAAQLARIGLPAVAGAFGLAVLVLAAACWMLGSTERCERAATVLRAWRGTPAPAAGTAAPDPARPRWRPWRRHPALTAQAVKREGL